MWAHRPNLMRAAFGGAPLFTSAQFGAHSLFNSSSGPHLLRVWAIVDRGANALTLSLQQSRLTTQNVGVITPAVTGEALPPGAIDQMSFAAAPAYNFAIPTPLGVPGVVHAIVPLVVLRPGWSLVATETGAAAALGVCFWWDYVFPIELLKPDIGDPEIDG